MVVSSVGFGSMEKAMNSSLESVIVFQVILDRSYLIHSQSGCVEKRLKQYAHIPFKTCKLWCNAQ